MITKKNLAYFIEWLKTDNDTICKLSNDHIALYKNNELYIIKNVFNAFDNMEITKDGEYIIQGWRINISITDEYITKPITMVDIIDGYYCYTEPIGEEYKIYVKNTLEKKDRTRKLFKNIYKLQIPKMTAGIVNFNIEKYVKIEAQFII